MNGGNISAKSEKDSGALAERRLRTCARQTFQGVSFHPLEMCVSCDRDRSGILFDDARRKKDKADSPAVAQIININVRKHLYILMPMHLRGLLRFIPFCKRLPLLYRYTSIDK